MWHMTHGLHCEQARIEDHQDTRIANRVRKQQVHHVGVTTLQYLSIKDLPSVIQYMHSKP
jgi:hypothetical protein